MPWTTAFVVDPVQESEGVFVWSGGEPSPVQEYWVGPERRVRPPTIAFGPPPLAASEPQATPSSAVSRASFAAAVVFGFLSLLFLSGYVYMREVGHSETEKFVLQALEAQKAELQATYQSVAALHSQFDESGKQSAADQQQIKQQIEQVGAGLRKAVEFANLLQSKITDQQQRLDQVVLDPPAERQNPDPAEVKKP
jgi:hypothetical protein